MRKAFSESLTRLAEDNPRLCLVTGDLGFQVFDAFQERFGPRYINVGVAEAQMIYVAAGLASEGWRPIAYSIASFASARPFEQIRFCVSYPNLPVVIVGAGRGYTYSTSGVSHHAPDDLGLMSILPGMTVVAPGDPTEVAQLLPQVFHLPGPAYFAVGRFGEPAYEAEEAAILGKARLIREGQSVAVISTGELASEAIKAYEILAQEGIFPVVYQMHTIKPLDTETLNRLSNKVHTFIIVEEHVPLGGLWSAVCMWHSILEKGPRLFRLGAPDTYALENLKLGDLRRRFQIDADSIAKACRQAWRD